MRPTLTILLLALTLNACGPMRQLQQVASQLPMIGSVGKHQSQLFKKEFQKMGEPTLVSPIAVSVQSVPFTSSMLGKYAKNREKQGLEPLAMERDTTKNTMTKYFKMIITDVVGLVEQLNQSDNAPLKKYLKEDTDLVLLSQISFVAQVEVSDKIKASDRFVLTTDRDGALSLQFESGATLKIADLEVFDFETANFCWNKDNKARLQIAHILMDGKTCPGDTEANPKKLDRTPDYLKL
jgi:hypothetical protein